MKGTGLLDSLGTGATGTGAAQATKSAAQSAAYTADRAVKQTSAIPGWVSWALPIAAVLALGYWFLGRPTTTVAESLKINDLRRRSASGSHAELHSEWP